LPCVVYFFGSDATKVQNIISKNKLLLAKLSPAANKVLPKAGRNGFDWTFLHSSTFVLRFSFSAKNPRLRQYPKR